MDILAKHCDDMSKMTQLKEKYKEKHGQVLKTAAHVKLYIKEDSFCSLLLNAEKSVIICVLRVDIPHTLLVFNCLFNTSLPH